MGREKHKIKEVYMVKQKTAYELRISDWSSDVCSSDLAQHPGRVEAETVIAVQHTAERVGREHVGQRGGREGQGLQPAGEGPVFQGGQGLGPAFDAARGGRGVIRRRKIAPLRRGADRHAFPSCRSASSAKLAGGRSEEHTSELQSLIRISDAVFCLTTKKRSPPTVPSWATM